MAWMARTRDRRADVRNVIPGARSVIVTATLYNTDRPYSEDLPQEVARLSRYAWGDDYHNVIKSRLDGLLAWMKSASGHAVRRASVRRYRPCAGACVCAVCRPRVDRQEHVRDQQRDRFVAVSRRNHLHPAARAGYAGARTVRQLHAMPRGVSHRCAGRAGCPGFEPVPVVSDHRAAIVDSGDATRVDRAATCTDAMSARKSVPTISPRRRRAMRHGSRAPDSTCRGWSTCGDGRTQSCARW